MNKYICPHVIQGLRCQDETGDEDDVCPHEIFHSILETTCNVDCLVSGYKSTIGCINISDDSDITRLAMSIKIKKREIYAFLVKERLTWSLKTSK